MTHYAKGLKLALKRAGIRSPVRSVIVNGQCVYAHAFTGITPEQRTILVASGCGIRMVSDYALIDYPVVTIKTERQ